MKYTLLLVFIMISIFGNSQEASIELAVSKDTILAGNQLTLTIKALNVNQEIDKPAVVGVDYLPGVSSTSFMQMSGGVVKNTLENRYTLYAANVGEYKIGPVNIKDSNNEITSNEITIVVLENPDGIIEEDNISEVGQGSFFDWEQRLNLGGEEKNKETPSDIKKKKRLKKL